MARVLTSPEIGGFAPVAQFVKQSHDWLTDFRLAGWHNFERRGLPGRRLEAWHYTDLPALLKADFLLAAQDRTQDETSPFGDDEYGVYFLNGEFQAALSRLPAGCKMESLRDALKVGTVAGLSRENFQTALQDICDRAALEHGGLCDLHQALLQEGFVLAIPDRADLQLPIHVVSRWTAQVSPTFGALLNWVVVGENARASLVEWVETEDHYTAAHLTQVQVGAQAEFEYARVQWASSRAKSLNLLSVQQSDKSRFVGVGLLAGGELIRETWVLDHAEKGASTHLSGLALGQNRQHLDLRSVINHEVGLGDSQQFFRALVAGHSRAIFNGKIAIARDAQEVNSRQLSQSLLLDATAEVDTKPELEIYADNVKASHGATVGQLDPEQKFYLESRGIRPAEAERLLAVGFAMSALDEIKSVKMKSRLKSWLTKQVGAVIARGPA